MQPICQHKKAPGYIKWLFKVTIPEAVSWGEGCRPPPLFGRKRGADSHRYVTSRARLLRTGQRVSSLSALSEVSRQGRDDTAAPAEVTSHRAVEHLTVNTRCQHGPQAPTAAAPAPGRAHQHSSLTLREQWKPEKLVLGTGHYFVQDVLPTTKIYWIRVCDLESTKKRAQSVGKIYRCKRHDSKVIVIGIIRKVCIPMLSYNQCPELLQLGRQLVSWKRVRSSVLVIQNIWRKHGWYF